MDTLDIRPAARRGEWLGAKRHFRGRLHFVFQPAEEHGHGAPTMLADGLLEKFPVEGIYDLHNAPGPVGSLATRIGGLTAAEDDLEIRITGMGGHAARPQRVIDPIVTASQIILALQTVLARNVDPEIIRDGTRNVIATTVVVKCDARRVSSSVQEPIESSMRRIVEGIRATSACGGDFSYTHEFEPKVNTRLATEIASRTAREVFDRVDGVCAPAMGAEDFAKLLAACGNGNFSFIGNTPPGRRRSANLHNPRYDFNDDALQFGVRYWIKLAEQRLPKSA